MLPLAIIAQYQHQFRRGRRRSHRRRMAHITSAECAPPMNMRVLRFQLKAMEGSIHSTIRCHRPRGGANGTFNLRRLCRALRLRAAVSWRSASSMACPVQCRARGRRIAIRSGRACFFPARRCSCRLRHFDANFDFVDEEGSYVVAHRPRITLSIEPAIMRRAAAAHRGRASPSN